MQANIKNLKIRKLSRPASRQFNAKLERITGRTGNFDSILMTVERASAALLLKGGRVWLVHDGNAGTLSWGQSLTMYRRLIQFADRHGLACESRDPATVRWLAGLESAIQPESTK
jgi:hypothetical protein